ncbi:putative ribonuclease H-like domain-containing protein [Tanacetum coccineum]
MVIFLTLSTKIFATFQRFSLGNFRGTDISKITRKQSKTGKHGHESQKSTKPKPEKSSPVTVVKQTEAKCVNSHRKEEGIDYDEVFAPVARIEVIRLFLAFASYMGFLVYQMDVKSAFLFGTIEEEVYVHQPPGFVDPAHPNKVYKVVKALYGLHQAPRAWYETLSSFLLENGFRREVYAQKIPDELHGRAYILFGTTLKQQPDEIFISQDKRLISWQCKKQTIMANFTTEAEYVAAAHCCGQVLWIQMDYGFNFINSKIHIDNESTICVVKDPVYHSRTKHIEIRHHFIRDCYEKRLIDVLKIHTDSNVADLLTKGFDVTKFIFLVVSALNVKSVV